MLNSRIFLILIILFLAGGTLFAQKTILIPPRLKLELPDDSWKLTSHNASEALWLNDEKVVESGDGQVKVTVSCFYRRNFPFGFMIVDHGIFLSSNIENGTMECDSLQGFRVCAVEGEKMNVFRAMQYTPDGYIVEILAEFNKMSKEESWSMLENILNQSEVVSLAQMDEEFGYPLDPTADNSEFIEERKQDLLEFYDEEWGFSWTMDGLNEAPLEEIVPELYDGFTFERLFSIWNRVLEEELDLNDFLNTMFLDKESPDLKLYFNYADRGSGDFWDLEFPLLNNYFGANPISEKYFNENGYWADTYEVCGDSGELVSVWRIYLDSTESNFICVSFHKNEEVLSSDRDWQVNVIGNTEHEILDEDVARFWLANIVGDDTDCSNEATNLVGFTALNCDSIETVYVGSPNNINTSIVPLEAYQQKEDEVHYLVYAFNSLTRRANRPMDSEFVNISDSLAYIFTSSSSLVEEFNELSKMNPELVTKQIDPLFVESYRGNQWKGVSGCRSIECDLKERPVIYAVNSKLFNLPPEKRVYSTSVIHEDLNNDGRVDAYFFSVSNGEVVHASIVYDMGDDVQAETSVEKYFEQFKNSEKGRLLTRISLDEKNLLPAFWPYFSYIK